MGRYLERYVYDKVGNFQQVIHAGSGPVNPGWTRTYTYDEASLIEAGEVSNRLTGTTIGANNESYSADGNGYDAHGNMLRMPHLQIMQWDFKDQLQMTQRQVVNPSDEDGVERQGERTWYVCDAAGQRVRKVTELASGAIKDERIYLGGFEIYRRRGANPLVRETLHIMDGKQRLALVETRTQGSDPSPKQLIRYQLGNHLGSASLELDHQAQIISYEEYYPYGNTSYQAVNGNIDVSRKRYRYTDMERDEENGLYYCGARYYAAWLGRWSSADPRGLIDGTNLFVYALDNPAIFIDQSGYQHDDPKKKSIDQGDDPEVHYSLCDITKQDFNLEEIVIKASDTLPHSTLPHPGAAIFNFGQEPSSPLEANFVTDYVSPVLKPSVKVKEPSLPYYLQDQTKLDGVTDRTKLEINQNNSAVWKPLFWIPIGLNNTS